jgi:hypothetical protein
MRLFLSLATGTMAVWLLLAGCSGGDSTLGAGSMGSGGSGTSSSTGNSTTTGVGGASAAAVQAYCNATAEPFCEAYFACCQDPGKRAWVGSTLEQCKHSFSYVGYRCGGDWAPAFEASIDAGHTVFDQASLDACVAHLKALSAGGAACVEPPFSFYATVCLTTVFQGQLAPGEPCANLPWNNANTSECKHGHCDWVTHTCLPLAQLGETCADNYPECEWGQWNKCAHEPYPNGPLICIHQGDIADPCVQDRECKSFTCNTMSGTCTLPDPMSSACF